MLSRRPRSTSVKPASPDYRPWHPAAQCAAGITVVAFLTFVAFRLHADPATAVVLYLIVIILMSVWARFAPAAVVSLVAAACIEYFFVPPTLTFGGDPLDFVAMVAFLTTALVITHLTSSSRASFQEIQDLQRELRLVVDTIPVPAWRAAADGSHEFISRPGLEYTLYGWTQAETIGAVTHELLHTIFPSPLEGITVALLRDGRWEGELVHTRRDGTPVIVASRWSLQRDGQGQPVGTLETNNDITARKRAEEAARKAQAELAHVARLTTLGEMAATIAHEVDQPLSGVVINANACMRFLAGVSPNLDEVRDGLLAIARDGRRASDVVGRIRALSRRVGDGPLDQPFDHRAAWRPALGRGERRSRHDVPFHGMTRRLMEEAQAGTRRSWRRRDDAAGWW
jgi:two-component system, LuxR family, sensor kinase FixL